MTILPAWLIQHLQCPLTGVPLTLEYRKGCPVFVARPLAGEPVYYQIDNGVPVLLPPEQGNKDPNT